MTLRRCCVVCMFLVVMARTEEVLCGVYVFGCDGAH